MIPTPKLFLLYRRNSRIFDRVAVVVLGDLITVGNTPSLRTADSADQRKFRRRTARGPNYLCMTYSRALQGIGIPRIHIPSTPPKNKNKTTWAGPH